MAKEDRVDAAAGAQAGTPPTAGAGPAARRPDGVADRARHAVCAGSARTPGSPARRRATRSARPTPRSAGWSWAGSASRNATSPTCSTLYGVTDDATSARRSSDLVREANTPGWWHRYGDVLPELVRDLPAAGAGRRGDPHLPGAVRAGPAPDRGLRPRRHPARPRGPRPRDEIERRVSLRMARQKLLTSADAPQLWAVVDEAALRRPYRAAAVMREQLEHLLEPSRRCRTSTLQVLPFRAAPRRGRRPVHRSCASPSRTCPTSSTSSS